MLGSTADSIYWLFRYLERIENTSILIEAGFQSALTSHKNSLNEWESILKTLGMEDYFDTESKKNSIDIVNFLLRNKENPNSILNLLSKIKYNAKISRVAITKEVSETINLLCIEINSKLKRKILIKDVYILLLKIREGISLVVGFFYGTMLRNEIFNFCLLGMFIERFDNTARILNVRYYSLLPNVNVKNNLFEEKQWEAILRSISAYKSFMWKNQNKISVEAILDFLIFNEKMPRSLKFCVNVILEKLKLILNKKTIKSKSYIKANEIYKKINFRKNKLSNDFGLHKHLNELITSNILLGNHIEEEFNFHK